MKVGTKSRMVNENTMENKIRFFFFYYFFFFFHFTFSYINKRKCWFRKIFWLPTFDGLTRFRMFWTWFEYFWKMSICVYVTKKIVASIARELMQRISWNFIFKVAINWCLSTFGGNSSTDGAVTTLFLELSG